LPLLQPVSASDATQIAATRTRYMRIISPDGCNDSSREPDTRIGTTNFV
jgi:hypothetical protein